MIRRLKIFLLILATCGVLSGHSQDNKMRDLQPVLFTDRDYCVSGDTLWFKVWIPEKLEEKSNVVHVQLDANNDNVISDVAVKSEQGWAEGYIHVPDSLSSGLYFVTSFLNNQRSLTEPEVLGSTLFVYNRFEESIFEMAVPEKSAFEKYANVDDDVQILTNQTVYKERGKVEGRVNIGSEKIAQAVVRAKMVDPLSYENGGRVKYAITIVNSEIPDFNEKDGILISGNVTDKQNNRKKGILVLLSISDDPPYFDYCVTGQEGDFHFYLKNATGTASVILQTVSGNEQELIIRSSGNVVQRVEKVPLTSKILTVDEAGYISDVIKGSFISKLFSQPSVTSKKYFEMPLRFEIPFYGPPSKRIVPDEFINLPDFREISRELLPGVQYRVRNNEVSFRMINLSQKMLFETEPLRLLNGIPVFKNNLFTSLKSTDIEYIDLVQSERVFGDLIFQGIMAVSLYDKSNQWAAFQPNIYRLEIQCLQPEREHNDSWPKVKSLSVPDMRQVFLWDVMEKGTHTFSFDLSDIKGSVEIAVEGITTDNRVFKTSKIIEVK